MSTYYVKSSGSDSNDGLSTSTPWKTLSHALPASMVPGGTPWIYCLDSFTETLSLSASYTLSNVLARGSGGGGRSHDDDNGDGGGGSGAANALTDSITVGNGDTIQVAVPAGGTDSTDGAAASLQQNGATKVSAPGGLKGALGAGSIVQGGQASACVGDVNKSGGSVNVGAGGGASSASDTTNGNNASSASGASAPSGSLLNGAAGGDQGNPGNAGADYGGGGGGGGSDEGGDYPGGQGGHGLIAFQPATTTGGSDGSTAAPFVLDSELTGFGNLLGL